MDRPRAIRKERYKGDPDPELVRVSRSMLAHSGVLRGLDELVDIIRPEFSDVEVNEHIDSDGSLTLAIDWNRRPIRIHPIHPINRYQYNSIAVRADPITEGLVVSSEGEDEFLRRLQWGSDARIVEDALGRAYMNPMRMIGPPQKM